MCLAMHKQDRNTIFVQRVSLDYNLHAELLRGCHLLVFFPNPQLMKAEIMGQHHTFCYKKVAFWSPLAVIEGKRKSKSLQYSGEWWDPNKVCLNIQNQTNWKNKMEEICSILRLALIHCIQDASCLLYFGFIIVRSTLSFGVRKILG